jgi:soluble lytic murein transglycosylase-like protein
MIRKLCLGTILLAFVALTAPVYAGDNLDPLIAKYAAAHKLPEPLLRRVIKLESGGNPRLVDKGNYGLMQIRLGTARSLGYSGSAEGLLDADTNMTYAVKYLAGAYRTANGDADRAVHYYQSGYYYAAKQSGHAEPRAEVRTKIHAEPRESESPGLLARLLSVLTSHASPPRAEQQVRKQRKARVKDTNVASSSSLYGGRRDYY